jgi:hypothetical protein
MRIAEKKTKSSSNAPRSHRKNERDGGLLGPVDLLLGTHTIPSNTNMSILQSLHLFFSSSIPILECSDIFASDAAKCSNQRWFLLRLVSDYSQGQESGLEQQTSITNPYPSPDKNSFGGLFSVNVTIFLIVGGILGLVGAAYAGKKYYRRARLFGRGVDKNFDDDSLDGHEQYPAVKLDPSDTTMNTSSGYSANEPGTEDFLRDLEDFKTFDTPSKGSSSGSSINLSGDADMLSLSLMGMALMSHNATKIFD